MERVKEIGRKGEEWGNEGLRQRGRQGGTE